MERTYKFYLSIDNSLCLDYITEKSFSTMNYNIIPIVMDAHGNHKQFAPPHSYINALDFPSVRHLADYLIKLDGNDTLYNEYFRWKDHYEAHFDPDYRLGFCNLCSALHNTSVHGPNQSKVYDNIIEWWSDRAQCKTVRFEFDANSETYNNSEKRKSSTDTTNNMVSPINFRLHDLVLKVL